MTASPLIRHLAKYAEYHRDRRNIASHFVGVPMILFSVVELLSRPAWMLGAVVVSPALVAAIATSEFYLRLDRKLGYLLAGFLALSILVGGVLASQGVVVWLASGLGIFVVGWIIQFVGHYYEGRKPAFVDDLIGLLIGPLFVAAELCFLVGWRRSLRAEIEALAGPTRDARVDQLAE
jgi:uncharacterized membrane protein YGL010W